MKVTSRYKDDKIGQLTQGGSNINLGPSVLTIGGLQYHTESTLTVAMPTLVANNRYQVYAVASSGAAILVISQNENSMGPAGYDSWKLVGSFYANGLSSVGFGSFVTITGKPSTGLVSYLPVVTNLGAATGLISGLYERDGVNCKVQIKLFQNGIAGTGGSTVSFSTPINAPINLTALQFVQNNLKNYAQTYGVEIATQFFISGCALLANGSGASVVIEDLGTGGAYSGSAFTATSEASIEVEFPVIGWSNTPIEDL